MIESGFYERVGGEAFFRKLVEHFYGLVARDEVLRPLYPADLATAERHLTWFLMQRWGGPAVYAERRGAPRLRMRHGAFPIGQIERDRWMAHMAAAVRAGGASDADAAELMAYFEDTATFLVNQG